MIRSGCSGFSLIETLLATALIGGIVAMVAGLYIHAHDQASYGEAVRETDELRGYVQAILNEPSHCKDVFQSISSWNYQSATDPNKPIPYPIISLNMGTSSVQVNSAYSRLLRVADMRIREPLPLEGGPARSMTTLQTGSGPMNFKLVAVKFVVTTQSLSAYKSAFLTRTADALLIFDQSNRFYSCASARKSASDGIDFTCANDTLTSGTACTQTPFCSPMWYIAGFLQDGSPDCRCGYSCFGGPQGPAGFAPPKPISGGGTGGGGSSGGGGNGGGGNR